MRSVITLALGLSFIFASTASALTLNPGDDLTTTVGTIFLPSSPNIVATHSAPITIQQGNVDTLVATLTDNVIKESNGDLTFQYLLTPTSVDFNSLDATVNNYASFKTDLVAYEIPAAVSSLNGHFQRSGDGSTIAISFTLARPVTDPKHSVGGFEIKTDATHFDSLGSLSLNAALSQSVTAFANVSSGPLAIPGQFEPIVSPVTTAVPLPSPALMAILGFPLAYVVGRRLATR